VPSNRDHHYRNLRDRYTNCTYVDGNLELTWLQDEHLDLSFLQHIREVTGYVLITHVDVNKIVLPRLQIIRGRTQFKLAVKEEEFSLLVMLSKMNNLELPALRGKSFYYFRMHVVFNILYSYHTFIQIYWPAMWAWSITIICAICAPLTGMRSSPGRGPSGCTCIISRTLNGNVHLVTSRVRAVVGAKVLTIVKSSQRSTVVPNVTKAVVLDRSPETAVICFVPVVVRDQSKVIAS